ncbi:MAG: hypothetical protein JNK82_30850 [Myxococcaceae bacterium]|nr:hypothetical protein [Myxococcaceae bacterium]
MRWRRPEEVGAVDEREEEAAEGAVLERDERVAEEARAREARAELEQAPDEHRDDGPGCGVGEGANEARHGEVAITITQPPALMFACALANGERRFFARSFGSARGRRGLSHV